MKSSFQGTRTNSLLEIERHGPLFKGARPGRPAHQACQEHVVDSQVASFVWFDILLVVSSRANIFTDFQFIGVVGGGLFFSEWEARDCDLRSIDLGVVARCGYLSKDRICLHSISRI